MAHLPLSDGTDIPTVFSAAFRCSSTEATKAQVVSFYNAGVRHFEIAELFGNGHIICEALREVCSERSELYITVKIWPKDHKPEELIDATDFLLQSLKVAYFDLLTVHAPIDVENRTEQYKALEEMKDRGMTKSIGIVNISAVMMQDLLKNCRISPVVYELESTPFFQNDDMVEFCADSSIIVMNNEPLGKGILSEKIELLEIAQKNGISVTKLLILWSFTKKNCVGLPANNPQIMHEINQGADGMEQGGIETFYKELKEEDMERLANLEMNLQTSWTPTENIEAE